MRLPPDNVRGLFERGVFILSIDTEQIWGYADYLTDAQFLRRFPGSIDAQQELLARLCAAGISATWFVVGGMALPGSSGPDDPRLAGVPRDCVARIPAGNEATMPLWYRESFVQRLHRARPQQEIALHGGLTHFIWTDARATRDVAAWELAEGMRALQRLGIEPCSFSFGRNLEAYLDLLPAQGIRVFRGRLPVLAWELGQTLPGAMVRLIEEIRRTTPPPVWPSQTIPGLWTIPSSTFLYPIGPARARLVGLRSRIERFTLGLEAAARHRGIFHFSLHPEN